MRHASDADFDQAVKEAGTVLVDFHAVWCGPCKAMEPALAALDAKIPVIKVDVDHSPAVAARFGIQSVPTLVVMKAGEPVAVRTGAMPAAQLERWAVEAAA